MTAATVTAIEPKEVQMQVVPASSWEKRTYDRAVYEYERALYEYIVLDGGNLKAVYMLGHILGKTVDMVNQDITNVGA